MESVKDVKCEKGKYMEKTEKTFKIAIVLVIICGLVAAAGKFMSSSMAQSSRVTVVQPGTPLQGSVGSVGSHWLSQFENKMVRVTFVQTPPDLDRTVTFYLVKADQSGIVLTFGNKRQVFYPYSNIVCVDPM
jgi:hypothetical protein